MNVLIVVDMQKDFIDGTLGTAEAVAAAGNVASRIASSRSELILFTQDTHSEDYLTTPEGIKLPIVHCIEDTPGWQIDSVVMDAWRNNPDTIIVPELVENVFKKSVFGSVDLVDFLKSRQNEIGRIEIVGVCTDICVISNAIMIKNAMPHIEINVNAACCAGVTPKGHQEALNVMRACHIDVVTPKEIYLAGGCFWGVEKYFTLLPGVLETNVGFANGNTENPSYEEVYTGSTGFAETIHVVYDAEQIDLDFILTQFYNIIDPTSKDRQGPDVGSHYRTGVYYTNPADGDIIAKSLGNLQKFYDAPVVVENLPLRNYYKADEYHQKYLDKNPGGYCHILPEKFQEAKETAVK